MTENVKRFKIIFATIVPDAPPELATGYDFRFERVIGASTTIIAERIAEAMVGEEVYADESLASVIRVEETDEPYSLNSSNPEYTNQRALKKANEGKERFGQFTVATDSDKRSDFLWTPQPSS